MAKFVITLEEALHHDSILKQIKHHHKRVLLLEKIESIVINIFT